MHNAREIYPCAGIYSPALIHIYTHSHYTHIHMVLKTTNSHSLSSSPCGSFPGLGAPQGSRSFP